MLTKLKNQPREIAVADISIEPALPEDVRKIWAIYRAGRLASQPNAELGITRGDVWAYLCGLSGEVVEQEIAKWEQRINTPVPGSQVLVAVWEPAEQVVGLVWPNTRDDQCRLDKLYVAKAAQGLGIGSRLIEAALDWHGREPVSLTVAAYNPAQELYKSHGFVPVREIASGYTIAGKTVPQVEMLYPGAGNIGQSIC